MGSKVKRFKVVFSEPDTGVVMLSSPIFAKTLQQAEREARAFLAKRSSIAHWGVNVSEDKSTPKKDGNA